MPDKNELTLRSPGTLVSKRERYMMQMELSRERLRQAMSHVRHRAHELTPAARISAHPFAWVAGGLVAGIALAFILPRRHRY